MAKTPTAFEVAARAHASSRASEGTRSLYLAELDRWLAWCEAHRVSAVRPTLQAATEFRDELNDKMAGLTVRRVLASLSSMYQAAMDQEKPLATWNPFKSLPRPPADAYTRTEAISDAAADQIIAGAARDSTMAGLRDHAILRLLYDTGLRRASVANIHSKNLFLRPVETSEELVLRALIKGNKEREVIVPAGAATALVLWMKSSALFAHGLPLNLLPDGYVFPSSTDCSRPITPSAINKIVEKRAKAVGIKGVHPHQFRTAFATAALDADTPLHEVQAAMHHEDPKTTLRYDRGQRGAKVTTAVAEHRQKNRS